MLAGKDIVFSGFRNALLEARLEELGAHVSTKVTLNTEIVVVKDAASTSTKVEAARRAGIPIVTLPDFLAMYLPNNAANAYAKPAKKAAAPKAPKARAFAELFDVDPSTPRTIANAEAALNTKLQNGDVVVFGGDRFMEALIVAGDGSSKRFVANPDYSQSGYLTIPLDATKSMTDAVKYYSKIYELIDSHLDSIDIAPSDKLFKKIFKKPTKLAKGAQMTYFPLGDYEKGEPGFTLAYNGARKMFTLKATQAAIEKTFDELLKPTIEVMINLNLEAMMMSSESTEVIRPSINITPSWVKSLKLPSGAKATAQGANLKVTVPADKYDALRQALSKISL